MNALMSQLGSQTAAWFAAGGPLMPAILAVSLSLYALIVHRMLTFRRSPRRTPQGGEDDRGAETYGDPSAGLSLIHALVSILPLLGLLGSVGGIMRTFDLAAFGVRGHAAAKGVGEALITTEFGLAAAVPGIVLHWWLVRRARLARGDRS